MNIYNILFIISPKLETTQTSFSLLLFILSVMPHFLQPHGLQHVSLSFTIPVTCSNSCSLSRQCYPTILSSVIPFYSCLLSFTASWYFLMSWLFTSSGQSIGAASASVLPMTIQGWFPLGLTGFISLLSSGLPRVFSSATVQKHQFFSSQSSLSSNLHIHTWLLKKP